MTVKVLSYAIIISVNPLHLIIDKIIGYIEESNENNLSLVPTDESKETLNKYEELWSKIRNFIRLITNNSNNYDEKYMKIKLNSDDENTKILKETLKFYNMIIVVISVFHEGNKYNSQVF